MKYWDTVKADPHPHLLFKYFYQGEITLARTFLRSHGEIILFSKLTWQPCVSESGHDINQINFRRTLSKQKCSSMEFPRWLIWRSCRSFINSSVHLFQFASAHSSRSPSCPGTENFTAWASPQHRLMLPSHRIHCVFVIYHCSPSCRG